MPDSLRWRLIALRGQCHFALRHFQAAQNDLQAAAGQQLDPLPADQLPEATLLHLHLAAASRELGQLDVAYKHYKIVLGMFKLNTPIQYVAEAHWGLALVAYERASHLAHESEEEQQQERALKQEARAHAIKARDLYSSINDELHAALLSCQLGLIEQALGNLETARACLQEVLESWWPRIHGISLDGQSAEEQRTLKERANLVSAAACYLAGLELACRRHEQALAYIHQAQQAAQKSYILRRAEAYIVLGQILEDQDVNNPEAENAFRNAIKELDQTDRVAAKIHAHDLLGRHLLKKRRIEEGTRELDLARGLAKTPPLLSSSTTPANDHL